MQSFLNDFYSLLLWIKEPAGGQMSQSIVVYKHIVNCETLSHQSTIWYYTPKNMTVIKYDFHD